MKTKLLRKLRKKFKKYVHIECGMLSLGDFVYWIEVEDVSGEFPPKYRRTIYDCPLFSRDPEQSKLCSLCCKYVNPYYRHGSMDGAIAQARCYIDARVDSFIRQVKIEHKETEISNFWKNFKL
jgi:hypothetical protein